LTRLILVISFIMSVTTVSAFYMKRESYVDIPSANFNRGLYFNLSSSYPVRDVDDVKFDPNFGIGFSYNRFGGALKWYNGADFSFDLSYQILEGNSNIPGLSIGMAEITVTQYISPAGSDKVFNDEDYPDRPPEIASAYLVGTKKIGENFEITAGLGRGRFVGYGPRSYIPNSDIFFEEKHKNWVIGLFGGMRIILPNKLAFILEDDGRDVNFGIEYQSELVRGTLALNKLELFTADEEWGFSPRISLNVSYKIMGMKKKVEESKKSPFAIELIDNKSRVPVAGSTIIRSQEGDTIAVSKNRKIHSFLLKPDVYIAHITSEGYFNKKIKMVVKGEVSRNLYTVELNKKSIPKKPIEAKGSIFSVDDFEGVKNTVEGMRVKFIFKEFDLSSRAYEVLDRIVELIGNDEDINIIVIGHTCAVGTYEDNQILSENRAEEVKEYLIWRGISPGRIKTEAYGERRPVAANDTEENREKNRRVQFILYKKVNDDSFENNIFQIPEY
jgi:outer membrane protein OmpA-like peptidoglycan-associated protein